MKTKRPLMLFCAAFTFALMLSFYCPFAVRVCLGAGFAALFLVLSIIFGLKHKTAVLSFVSLAAAVGAAVSMLFLDVFVGKTAEKYENTETYYTAHVDGVLTRAPYYSAFEITVKTADGKPARFSAVLECDGELDAQTGENIAFSGTLESVSGDYEYVDKGGGTFFTLKTEKTEYIDTKYTFFDTVNGVSDRLSDKLKTVCGEDGFLASALLFGDKKDVPDTVKRDFSRLGISHVLAVSGLHLSVVVGALYFVLRRLVKNKWGVVIPCFAVIISFSLLTGLRYSVIRAGIMLIFVIVSKESGRKRDVFTSLFFASALILLFTPYAVYDVGFLCSFSAVFGLISMGKTLSTLLAAKIISRVGRFAVNSVCATVSVLVFTLPVTYAFFGELSLGGLYANIIFIPLAGAELILSVLTLIIPFLSPITAFLCTFTVGFAGKIAAFSPDNIYIGYDFIPLCFVITALIFTLIFLKTEGLKRKILSVTVPLITLILTTTLCATVYNIGRNDALTLCVTATEINDFFVARDGGVIFVDNSTGGWRETEKAIKTGLEGVCATDIDTVVLPHLHENHIRSLEKILSHYYPAEVIIPSECDCEVAEQIAALTTKHGVKLTCFVSGSEIVFGQSTLEITDAEHYGSHVGIGIFFGHGADKYGFYTPNVKSVNIRFPSFVLSHGGKGGQIDGACGRLPLGTEIFILK